MREYIRTLFLKDNPIPPINLYVMARLPIKLDKKYHAVYKESIKDKKRVYSSVATHPVYLQRLKEG